MQYRKLRVVTVAAGLMGYMVSGIASEKIIVYNGTRKTVYISPVLYTTANHQEFHKEEKEWLACKDPKKCGKLDVFEVAPGNYVKIDRLPYSFYVDRDIWFSSNPTSLADSLDNESIRGEAYMRFFNVGSSVKEVYVADVNGMPVGYASVKEFDKNNKTMWNSIRPMGKNTLWVYKTFKNKYISLTYK